MQTEIVKNNNSLVSNLKIRKDILDFESMLSKVPGAVFGFDNDLCPVKHSFTDGIYTREMFIPKGVALTGVIWNSEFPYYVTKGELIIVNEFEGRKVVKSPCSLISKRGTKRAIFAKEDSILITIHHNPDNCTDTDELMDRMSSNTYSEYEDKQQISQPVIPSNNCGIKALKRLSPLKTISVKTIIDMAKDNGLTLYPYKVTLNELESIPLPAIVHSKNHFDYISKIEELSYDKEYTGIILLTKKSNYKKIKSSELNNIIGQSGIITAAVITTVGGLITLGVTEGRKSVTECGKLCREQCRTKTGWLFSGRKDCIGRCKNNCVGGLTPTEKEEERKKEEEEKKNINRLYIIAGVIFAIALGLVIWYIVKKK